GLLLQPHQHLVGVRDPGVPQRSAVCRHRCAVDRCARRRCRRGPVAASGLGEHRVGLRDAARRGRPALRCPVRGGDPQHRRVRRAELVQHGLVLRSAGGGGQAAPARACAALHVARQGVQGAGRREHRVGIRGNPEAPRGASGRARLAGPGGARGSAASREVRL
ncbi:unnamed protein product, partial [Prorocentrum cordatum]